MRDFHDAKAMAASLRQALKGRDYTLTHSDSLELIAKAFGFDNWNILAAKIEAERTRAANLTPASGDGLLRCSFCRKSQLEVSALIAGPDVHICSECVGLCVGIIDDVEFDREIAALSEADRFEAAIEHLRGKASLDAYTARARDWRAHIEWSLGQIANALERLETGAPWTPDSFGAARGWTRDPLAGKSREQILKHRDALERQQAQLGERLRAAEHLQAEREAEPS